MKSISCYYTVIAREYDRGKDNFNKRFPIMVSNANDLFRSGRISLSQRNALLKRLNCYKIMNGGVTMLSKKRKKQITITIDEDLYNLIKVFSLKTSLTVSSTINLFLRRAFNETRA